MNDLTHGHACARGRREGAAQDLVCGDELLQGGAERGLLTLDDDRTLSSRAGFGAREQAPLLRGTGGTWSRRLAVTGSWLPRSIVLCRARPRRPRKARRRAFGTPLALGEAEREQPGVGFSQGALQEGAELRGELVDGRRLEDVAVVAEVPLDRRPRAHRCRSARSKRA